MPHYVSIQDFLLANDFVFSDGAFRRGFVVIPAEDIAGKPLSYFEERYTLTETDSAPAHAPVKKEKTVMEKAWELSQATILLSSFGEYGTTDTAHTYRVLIATFSHGASINLIENGKTALVPVQAVKEKICEIVTWIGPGKIDILDQAVREAIYQEFLASV